MIKELVEKVQKLLDDNNLWADAYNYNDIAIAVEVNRGDWKHDHLRTEWLLKENGFTKITSKVTEEDGSDTYSAIHYFVTTK